MFDCHPDRRALRVPLSAVLDYGDWAVANWILAPNENAGIGRSALRSRLSRPFRTGEGFSGRLGCFTDCDVHLPDRDRRRNREFPLQRYRCLAGR